MHFIPLPPIRCGRHPFSADQVLPEHRSYGHCLLHQSVKQKSPRRRGPAVEPERKLIQVIVQVGRTYRSLVRAQQPAFEQRGNAIGAGEQVLAQFRRRPDHFAPVAQALKTTVPVPIVGLDATAWLNRLPDCRFDAGGGSVRNSRQTNTTDSSALGLRGDQNQSFAAGSTASLSGLRSTDEGFIDFHDASQTVPAWSDHCSPQLMQPTPGRAVASEAQHSLYPQRTGARFLVGNIPDSLKPKSQRLMRIGKQRPGRDCEVVTTPLAAIERWRHRPNLLTRAIRTANAPRPTQLNQIVAAGLLAREPIPKFQHRLWIVGHARELLQPVVRGIKCIPPIIFSQLLRDYPVGGSLPTPALFS